VQPSLVVFVSNSGQFRVLAQQFRDRRSISLLHCVQKFLALCHSFILVLTTLWRTIILPQTGSDPPEPGEIFKFRKVKVLLVSLLLVAAQTIATGFED
jgi:hypothetical protein